VTLVNGSSSSASSNKFASVVASGATAIRSMAYCEVAALLTLPFTRKPSAAFSLLSACSSLLGVSGAPEVGATSALFFRVAALTVDGALNGALASCTLALIWSSGSSFNSHLLPAMSAATTTSARSAATTARAPN